jgi:TPP-dependent 2-oxoacid decarboxylase
VERAVLGKDAKYNDVANWRWDPLIRGEKMTAERLDAVLRQVQSIKTRKAQELLNKRLNAEERSA